METLLLLAHLVNGFQFPSDCCGAGDCYEISETEVRDLGQDRWLILETNEIMPAKHSPDGKFYRCSSLAARKGKTYCLFVPQWGS